MKTQSIQALQDEPYDGFSTKIKWNQLELKKINENELEVRKTLQLCSILFEYPEQDLDYYLVEDSIKGLNNSQIRETLGYFWKEYTEKDFIERAEEYVTTFDFNPSTSLYLTSSDEKQDKDRGMALLHMKEIYSENGLTLNARELPDYFPVFLEFLSIAPISLIRTALNTYTKPIMDLASALRKANSPYHLVMDACLIEFSELLEDKEVFR